MASNYEVEARGLLIWKVTSRTVTFLGEDYTVEFAELAPTTLAEDRVEAINDHTAELTVKDPRGLV